MQNRDLILKYFPYDTPRQGQIEAVESIMDAYDHGKKYVILDAPTGHGKSATSVMVARALTEKYSLEPFDRSSPPAIIASKTLALQTQYDEEFADVASLWSSERYDCAFDFSNENLHYGDYQCEKSECPVLHLCDFNNAKKNFRNAPVGILNYHYLYYSQRTAPILICDESHCIESLFSSLMSIDLKSRTVASILSLTRQADLISPEMETEVNDLVKKITCLDPNEGRWQDFLQEKAEELHKALGIVKQRIESYIDTFRKNLKASEEEVSNADPLFKRLAQIPKRLPNLMDPLNILVNSKTQWIVAEQTIEADQSSIRVTPLEITELSYRFFDRFQFIVFMSATLGNLKNYSKILGLESEKCEYLTLPHQIEVDRRRVYAFKGLSMSYKNKEKVFPKFIEVTDAIIDEHPEERGLIHSVSYSNAAQIKKLSRHSHRMLIPEPKDVPYVKEIIAENPDRIIVSPSVLEGVDLKGDLSRFTIFFKVPWLNLRDQYIKAKMEMSPFWYTYHASLLILQGAGRSTRDPKDFSTTYVIDSSFIRLINQNGLFPEWFKEAVSFV